MSYIMYNIHFYCIMYYVLNGICYNNDVIYLFYYNISTKSTGMWMQIIFSMRYNHVVYVINDN